MLMKQPVKHACLNYREEVVLEQRMKGYNICLLTKVHPQTKKVT
jgi:hypothetical protein